VTFINLPEYSDYSHGEMILQEPTVQLVNLEDGVIINLEAYECTPETAERFASAFRRVLDALPKAASSLLKQFWRQKEGCPHVWLLQDRDEWSGRGWAAGSPSSLYFVSTLIPDLPEKYLEGFIAHEFGHMLFMAAGEPVHTANTRSPQDRDRCEWLVWQLMKAWGYDQIGMEVWMECNYLDDTKGIQKRESSLTDAEITEGRNAKYRSEINQRFSNESLPSAYLCFTTTQV
jgi:hypothetical protein